MGGGNQPRRGSEYYDVVLKWATENGFFIRTVVKGKDTFTTITKTQEDFQIYHASAKKTCGPITWFVANDFGDSVSFFCSTSRSVRYLRIAEDSSFSVTNCTAKDWKGSYPESFKISRNTFDQNFYEMFDEFVKK